MRLPALAALTAAAAALAPALHAQPLFGCDRAVVDELRRLGLGEEDYTYVYYFEDPSHFSRRRQHTVSGYQAWVGLPNCRGHLVISLAPNCAITQDYTRGQCQVPGVVHYRF